MNELDDRILSFIHVSLAVLLTFQECCTWLLFGLFTVIRPTIYG